MRKYEAAFLAPNGDMRTVTRLAPASLTFEMPFMAFARGTLMATPSGPVAIEDVQPGLELSTLNGRAQRVLWKGSTTIVPGAPGQNPEAAALARIPADAMGLSRPSHDLLLGCGARVYRTGQGLLAP